MDKHSYVIIKLGGSLITDKTKPYTANFPVIKRLVREIIGANVHVIIIHGQGSFAHTSAKKYGGKKGYESLLGVATVFKDVMQINSIVMDELIKVKLPAVSFRPNSLFIANKGKMAFHNLEVIVEALKQGLIPVLYGDVILDKVWKTTIFSGETTTAYLVAYLQQRNMKISKIVQAGITDGVYDKEGKTIEEITLDNYKSIKKSISGSVSVDVTGGMLHKVEESLKVAKISIPTFIINGNRKNELKNILMNRQSKFTTAINII